MWFADPPPNALVRYSRDSVHRASSWVSLVSNPPPARNATAYPACIAAPLASVDSSNTYFALCSGHTAPFDSSYAPIQAIADGHSRRRTRNPPPASPSPPPPPTPPRTSSPPPPPPTPPREDRSPSVDTPRASRRSSPARNPPSPRTRAPPPPPTSSSPRTRARRRHRRLARGVKLPEHPRAIRRDVLRANITGVHGRDGHEGAVQRVHSSKR